MPPPQTEPTLVGSADDDDLAADYLRLVRESLPAAAAAAAGERWPIHLDHCFMRVVLDAVCGRPWREIVPAPAHRNLSADQLRRAITIARSMLDGGRPRVAELNDASLRCRGRPAR